MLLNASIDPKKIYFTANGVFYHILLTFPPLLKVSANLGQCLGVKWDNYLTAIYASFSQDHTLKVNHVEV